MNRSEIFLMRHGYDDHSTVDGKNDTSLTTNGIETTRNSSIEFLHNLRQHDSGAIAIHVSSRRRAIETGEIFFETLEKNGVQATLSIDTDLRELYQGKLLGLTAMTHAQRVEMLHLGWELFERERLRGNDAYKFGEPDYDNPRYALFNSFVEYPYGESQDELAERIRTAYLHILLNIQVTASTPLVIAHRGTIREVLNANNAHNGSQVTINRLA
jgi:broad specificity phosphatase PhoE